LIWVGGATTWFEEYIVEKIPKAGGKRRGVEMNWKGL
jgi:hypothetical protein